MYICECVLKTGIYIVPGAHKGEGASKCGDSCRVFLLWKLLDVIHTFISFSRIIVSAHRRILGMASVVCVLVKICVSSTSLYKLDTDKLTAPFESAHQLYPSMHSFRLQNCSRLSLPSMLKISVLF